MSTPDAAPVEVEGGRPEVRWLPIAWHRDLPDETRWMPIDRNGGYLVKGSDWSGQSNDPVVVVAWPDGTTPTPPAAPTTPDIADERVTELRAWLIGRMVAADERVQRAATLLDERRYDEARGQSEAFMQSINALDRALATPSTPGAGQGREIEAFRSWLADEAANGHGSRREGMALALRHLNDTLPEPATGQGEPS